MSVDWRADFMTQRLMGLTLIIALVAVAFVGINAVFRPAEATSSAVVAQGAPTATVDHSSMDMSGMEMSATADPTIEMTGMDMGAMDMGESMVGATLTASAANMAGMEMGGMDMSTEMINQMIGMSYMSDEDMALMMAHMAPISRENLVASPETQGGQPLDYTVDGDVKVFELTARPYLWNILPDVQTVAWTYNGQLPGPLIRVTEGDRVRVILRNELPEPTTIHFHGQTVPIEQDGVPGISQPLVQPGESFTYEFTAGPAGTFWYHSHYHEDFQVLLGLYAPMIVDPRETTEPEPDVDVVLMLSERRIMGGETFAAMPMMGMEPNYFTINGKAFPSVPPIFATQGDRVRIRLIGTGQFIHPIHVHGYRFQVVAIDGAPVPEAARQSMDTIQVAPGQRFDIELIADQVGAWMIQCHIPHHTTNNFRIGMGGLVDFLVVNPAPEGETTQPEATDDPDKVEGGFVEPTAAFDAPQGGFVEPTPTAPPGS
jgi:hypothetical protein